MPENPTYPCPYCQIGHCQLGEATYVRLYGHQLVSVPNTPLWMCDICGFQEFDRDALMKIETLLAQSHMNREVKRTSTPDLTKSQRARRDKT